MPLVILGVYPAELDDPTAELVATQLLLDSTVPISEPLIMRQPVEVPGRQCQR